MAAEPNPANWVAEQRRRAQELTVNWADRAMLEYEEARHFEEQAKAKSSVPFANTDADRRQGEEHATLSGEARHLAEMWARVTGALTAAEHERGG